MEVEPRDDGGSNVLIESAPRTWRLFDFGSNAGNVRALASVLQHPSAR